MIRAPHTHTHIAGAPPQPAAATTNDPTSHSSVTAPGGTADGTMAVDHVSGASVAADGAIDPATGIAVDMAQRNNKRGDASQPPPPVKKRRRSRGLAQAARHAAFLASRQ